VQAEPDRELSPEERQIVLAFREHRRAAYWPVQGYRFRLVQAFEAALVSQAPLAAAVLRAHGHDLRPIAERFGASIGWRDYGRHLGRAARDLLAFVADALAEQVAGLRDLVTLETTKLELLARLSDLPAQHWAAPEHPEALDETCRYRCSPAAALLRVDRDLSPWFDAPELAGERVPAVGPSHMVVYLDSLDEPPQYAGLSDDAATVFAALHEPLLPEEVAAYLGTPPAVRRARHAMTALLDIRVIRKDSPDLPSSTARP
jgi:hypothetical protein